MLLDGDDHHQNDSSASVYRTDKLNHSTYSSCRGFRRQTKTKIIIKEENKTRTTNQNNQQQDRKDQRSRPIKPTLASSSSSSSSSLTWSSSVVNVTSNLPPAKARAPSLTKQDLNHSALIDHSGHSQRQCLSAKTNGGQPSIDRHQEEEVAEKVSLLDNNNEFYHSHHPTVPSWMIIENRAARSIQTRSSGHIEHIGHMSPARQGQQVQSTNVCSLVEQFTCRHHSPTTSSERALFSHSDDHPFEHNQETINSFDNLSTTDDLVFFNNQFDISENYDRILSKQVLFKNDCQINKQKTNLNDRSLIKYGCFCDLAYHNLCNDRFGQNSSQIFPLFFNQNNTNYSTNRTESTKSSFSRLKYYLWTSSSSISSRLSRVCYKSHRHYSHQRHLHHSRFIRNSNNYHFHNYPNGSNFHQNKHHLNNFINYTFQDNSTNRIKIQTKDCSTKDDQFLVGFAGGQTRNSSINNNNNVGQQESCPIKNSIKIFDNNGRMNVPSDGVLDDDDDDDDYLQTKLSSTATVEEQQLLLEWEPPKIEVVNYDYRKNKKTTKPKNQNHSSSSEYYLSDYIGQNPSSSTTHTRQTKTQDYCNISSSSTSINTSTGTNASTICLSTIMEILPLILLLSMGVIISTTCAKYTFQSSSSPSLTSSYNNSNNNDQHYFEWPPHPPPFHQLTGKKNNSTVNQPTTSNTTSHVHDIMLGDEEPNIGHYHHHHDRHVELIGQSVHDPLAPGPPISHHKFQLASRSRFEQIQPHSSSASAALPASMPLYSYQSPLESVSNQQSSYSSSSTTSTGDNSQQHQQQMFAQLAHQYSAMHLQWLSNSSVTCNDGTRAGYYIRPSPPSGPGGSRSRRWLIFLEGGWYCMSKSACDQRWHKMRDFMTSFRWSQYKTFSGILSSSRSVNPYWWNANHVFIPYCSSDIWSGDSPAPPTEMAFLGSRIIDEVIGELVRAPQYQFLDAKFVLLAGSSAGAAGVMINLDRVAKMVRDAGSQADVRGLADSGWILDNDPLGPVSATNRMYSNVMAEHKHHHKQATLQQPQMSHHHSHHHHHIKMMPTCPDGTNCSPADTIKGAYRLWNSRVPEACAKQYPMEPWRCYFGYRLYPTLSTPLFVVQFQYDEFQIYMDGMTGTRALNDMEKMHYIRRLSEHMISTLANVSAVFAPSCMAHILLTKLDWHKVIIHGVTLPEALNCWEQTPLFNTNHRAAHHNVYNQWSPYSHRITHQFNQLQWKTHSIPLPRQQDDQNELSQFYSGSSSSSATNHLLNYLLMKQHTTNGQNNHKFYWKFNLNNNNNNDSINGANNTSPIASGTNSSQNGGSQPFPSKKSRKKKKRRKGGGTHHHRRPSTESPLSSSTDGTQQMTNTSQIDSSIQNDYSSNSYDYQHQKGIKKFIDSFSKRSGGDGVGNKQKFPSSNTYDDHSYHWIDGAASGGWTATSTTSKSTPSTLNNEQSIIMSPSIVQHHYGHQHHRSTMCHYRLIDNHQYPQRNQECPRLQFSQQQQTQPANSAILNQNRSSPPNNNNPTNEQVT